MNSSCFDPIDPKIFECKRARLKEIREQEKIYAKLICDYARKFQEKEQLEIAKERKEQARLLEQQNKEIILKENLAFAKKLEEAQKNAAEAEKQAQIIRDQKLLKQKEYDIKSAERFRKALIKLAEEKGYRESLKPRHPNFYSSSIERHPITNDTAFKEIERAIENRYRKTNYRPKSTPTPITKDDNDIVKKHTLTFLNVYPAKLVNFRVEESGQKEFEVTDDKDSEIEDEQTRVNKEIQEMKRAEQREKARLRGKQAARVIRIEKVRQEMMQELSFMQKKDLQRKRKNLDSNKPQFPPYIEQKVIEKRRQRELESKFECLFLPDDNYPTINCDKFNDLITQQKKLHSEYLENDCNTLSNE